MEPDDIDVQVHKGTLVVRGEKQGVIEKQIDSYFFSEREFGTFLRSFRLPSGAHVEEIKSDFRSGVLSIVVPKIGTVPGHSRKYSVRTE